jgi:hypothetical protein
LVEQISVTFDATYELLLRCVVRVLCCVFQWFP